ncbi:MAG: hypothetical protein ACR2MP_34470 [Streptosporangiaceae bacterium]
MNDELLSPPFAAEDTFRDLIYRLGGISNNGSTNIFPGWDWVVILSGLEGAVSRYNAGLGKQNGISARVAVGEALWWIAAADEFIRKRVSNNMSLSAYSAEMQKTIAGRRLAGLVYLRNRAGHQLAAVLQQSIASQSADVRVVQDDGTIRINTLTARIDADMKAFDISPSEGYFFAQLTSLPPSDSGFQERNRRDICYKDLVARQSVARALGAVAQSLNSVIVFERSQGNVNIRVNGSGGLPT